MAEHLEKSEWLSYALALPVGATRRIKHSCGDGTPMKISNHGAEQDAYCFRCGLSGRNTPQLSLAQRIAIAEAQRHREAAFAVKGSLPPDATTELPVKALAWLALNGMMKEDIEWLKPMYSASMDRLIIPTTSGYTARDMNWQRGVTQRPKYLFSGGGVVHRVPTAPIIPRCLVLTEDALSACAVGRTQDALCLMGTKMTTDKLAYIVRHGYNRCLLWLDGDQAGIDGRRHIARPLSLYCKVQYTSTPVDPKKLHPREITNKLKEVLLHGN